MQVSPFSFPPAFIGVGYGVPAPGMGPIATDPRKEYVAGGYGFLQRNIPQVLPWMVDDVTREFGPEVYDAMNTDATTAGTFRLWKMAVLASDIRVIPAVQPAAEKRSPEARSEWSPDEVLAQEIAEFVERSIRRCETPIKTVFSQMLDCARLGNKLAEKLAEPGTGDDEGRLVLKDLKVKPRWSWLYVADVFLSLVGILAFDPQEGGFVIVPQSKFFRTVWQQQDNDPRGTSLFRGAYRPWNVKQLLYQDYHKHLAQFASPTVVGTTPEGQDANLLIPFKNENGTVEDISPQEHMNRAITEAWKNGAALTVPFGATVKPEWPQGDGEPFLKAFGWLDRQIVYALLGSTRDSMEAEHGSKADSETGQDKTGNQIRTGRECIEKPFDRDVIRWLVELNWGPEVAARLSPTVSLGDVEHQDVVALMNGVSTMLKAGGIDMVSQGASLHAMLDLPPAAPGAFERLAKEKADAAAAKGKGGKGEPGDDDEKDDDE